MCRHPTILWRLGIGIATFFFLPDKKNERLSCSLSRNKQKQETSESDNDQEEMEHHRRFYIHPVILLGIFLAVAATSFYAGVILRTLMMISHHSGSELKLDSFKQAAIISKQLPNAIPEKEKNVDDDIMVDNMRNDDSFQSMAGMISSKQLMTWPRMRAKINQEERWRTRTTSITKRWFILR